MAPVKTTGYLEVPWYQNKLFLPGVRSMSNDNPVKMFPSVLIFDTIVACAVLYEGQEY